MLSNTITFRLKQSVLLLFFFTHFEDANLVAQDKVSEQKEVSESFTEVEESLMSYFDFTLNPSFPINTFKEKLDRNMFGFSLALSRQRSADRMDFLGFQISYAHLGAISNLYPAFEERTGTNLLNFQLLYRYFPDFYFWRIEPFVEATLGPQVIYTLTTTSFLDDDSSDFKFEESDWGLSYAAGLGFTLHIAKSVLFITKISYTGGTAYTYLTADEYVSGLPIDNFDSETSSVNYLQLQLGVSYIF